MNKNHKIILAFILLLFISIILGIAIGSVNFSIKETLLALFNKGNNIAAITIINNMRLPRVLMAGLVGASLSLGGLIMQSILKNPLADGTSLGVSSGATIGIVISLGFAITLSGINIFIAIIFACISLFVVLKLSYFLDKNISNNTVILSGIIFSMFANAIVSICLVIFSNDIKRIVFWTLGSLSGTSYLAIIIFLPFFIVSVVSSFLYTKELDSFVLGEVGAKHIGVNVKSTKIFLFIIASILVSVSVAFTGTIAFVGIIIPNMVRKIIKNKHKYLIPLSLIFGSSFLIIADIISRTVISPRELPIGTITSIIGVIVFIYILIISRKRENIC